MPKGFRLIFGALILICVLGLGVSPGNSAALPVGAAISRDSLGDSLQQAMIGPSLDAAPQTASFVAFRKRFQLTGPLTVGTIHLFADARYLLWINGTYVLRGPARFEPSGPQFDSKDVTQYLRAGPNEVAVLVLTNASNGKMRLHKPCLTMRLDIRGNNSLSTDETWKWTDQTRYRPPHVTWGNVADDIDTRMDDGDWTALDYDDTNWKLAVKVDGAGWGPITPRCIPLLREADVDPRFADGVALPVTLAAGQKLAFQTGRLIQAYTVLRIDADVGSTLKLDYAGIRYIARAGDQIYISSDTHGIYGGSISVERGRVAIKELKFVETLYPFDVEGSFYSNDDLLNRLWAMCARSCQVCSEDSYVDCADRERTEWMDNDPPAFDVTSTAMTGISDDGARVASDPRLLKDMLRRTALTVQPQGWVKAHTCSDRFDIHAKMEDRACDWVEGARRYYDRTRDIDEIREIWPVIVSQMNYFLRSRGPRGLVLAREWEAWGNPLGYVTCEGTGLNAFTCKALRDASYLGGVIGEKRQAAEFDRTATEISAAINSTLWDEQAGTYYSCYAPSGAIEGDPRVPAAWMPRASQLKVENCLAEPTAFCALMALDQGVVPATRVRAVTEYLMAARHQPAHMMYYYYLFKQMYGLDQPSLDTEILQTIRQKWKPMVDSPWQTSWEEFQGGSKAHIYGMFPGYFLSAYVLGVRPDGPMWAKRIIVEPHLGDLSAASGAVVTEYGAVAVSWKVAADRLEFRVGVPQGVTAALRIPEMGPQATLTIDGKAQTTRTNGRFVVRELGSGEHSGLVVVIR